MNCGMLNPMAGKVKGPVVQLKRGQPTSDPSLQIGYCFLSEDRGGGNKPNRPQKLLPSPLLLSICEDKKRQGRQLK